VIGVVAHGRHSDDSAIGASEARGALDITAPMLYTNVSLGLPPACGRPATGSRDYNRRKAVAKRIGKTRAADKATAGKSGAEAKDVTVRRERAASKGPTNHKPKAAQPSKAKFAASVRSREVSEAQLAKKPREGTEEKPARTRLTPKELEEFRELLLAKRQEIVRDMGSLTDGALGVNRQDAAGDLSLMPNHMADLGSDNWEQEFNLGLMENQRQVLREIDEALERIENGTYGICLGTGKPITKARLRAKPWAKYCIEYARLRERRGLS